jgi:hypothetical protein
MSATASPPLSSNSHAVLGEYTARDGCAREIVCRDGAGGSVLVVDRNLLTLGDRRLVAHIASDEPAANAQVVCDQYLADVNGRFCRPMRSEDLAVVPFGDDSGEALEGSLAGQQMDRWPSGGKIVDGDLREYRLELVGSNMSIREMRWQQYPPEGRAGPARMVSVREAIGALESYEPVRSLTGAAVERYRCDREVSIAILCEEIERICASRLVLNRGLREAVLARAREQEVSMSEIAMRCGRVKYDSRGNGSGETSWLARRLGLAPEGGEVRPRPWIHSDVLGLIARAGLRVSPREVELG